MIVIRRYKGNKISFFKLSFWLIIIIVKIGDKHVRGLLQFGIRAGMDPMEDFEERIVRVVLAALYEG